MPLYHGTIWTIDSRVNASFEMKDAYGGLIKGRLDFPKCTSRAKSFYVRHNGASGGTAFSTVNDLCTGIGGSIVSPQGDFETTIEFDTTTTSLGGGIYQVMAAFAHEPSPYEVVTQADAVRFMRSYGVDVYKWSGSQELSATAGNNQFNLATLDLTPELTSGDTEVDTSTKAFRVVPYRTQPRGLMVTSLITGNFINKLPHEVCLQVVKPSNNTVYQSAPVAVTSNTMTQVCANAMLYTKDLNHPFSHEGFQLKLVNLSAEALTMTKVEVRIHTFNNPDFSQ